MITRTIRIRPRRLAAAAPDGDESRSRVRIDPAAHSMAVEWGVWARTRRLFGAPPRVRSVLGSLRQAPAATGQPAVPNAVCSADLSAFNIAVSAYPDKVARAAFAQAFVANARPVKAAAEQLGVGRTQWYRMVAAVAHSAYHAYPRWLGTGT